MTAPSAGNLYLIESDGTDNDDWITDHGGDPDLLDLSVYTLGTEYCYLQFPQRWSQQGRTGIVVKDSGGGISFEERNERRSYFVNLMGIAETRTLANQFDQFVMAPRHTSGASATYKNYYLIIYFGTNDHIKFTDGSGTQQSYCKGVISPNFRINWVHSEHQAARVHFLFKSVWD